MPQLKILISGGGVAGTALAFWLSKLNHRVTVVEHFPDLRTTGLQIDLRGHGIEVLRRMGLEQAFRGKAAPEEGMQFIDLKGRKRAYMPANKTGGGAQGITSEYEIMRGDLCRLIHDATNLERTKYVFGTSVESFKETGGGVEVVFKNGDTEKFDLWVGADGVWSSTRRKMVGEEAGKNAFHSIGESNAYLTFKKPIEDGERYVGQMYLATQSRSMLLRRHSPEEMQLYLLLSRENERLKKVRRGDVPEEKKAFAEIFQGAGWRTDEMIEAMQDSDDFYCERLGAIKMDSWHQGHVALVGDAAYAAGGSGMGTSTAMVGAYVLAGEISNYCGAQINGEEMGTSEDLEDKGIAAALKSYDQTFRPYTDTIQKGLSFGPGGWFPPSSAWAISIIHLIAEALMWLRLDLVATYFMKEAREGWKLPEYEEMMRAKEANDGRS